MAFLQNKRRIKFMNYYLNKALRKFLQKAVNVMIGLFFLRQMKK